MQPKAAYDIFLKFIVGFLYWIRLERCYHAKRHGDGTRVYVLVHATEYFRVETIVFGDYERILYGTVQAQAEFVLEQRRPCVAESYVVAAYKAGVRTK